MAEKGRGRVSEIESRGYIVKTRGKRCKETIGRKGERET